MLTEDYRHVGTLHQHCPKGAKRPQNKQTSLEVCGPIGRKNLCHMTKEEQEGPIRKKADSGLHLGVRAATTRVWLPSLFYKSTEEFGLGGGMFYGDFKGLNRIFAAKFGSECRDCTFSLV